ncbi:BPL-N domain-containing protein [Pseudodesulfovibrio senegalensis]|uniref:Biotin--protein ligase n=1 Tax=Pseudodesulfovibrio senegalensis TaxID=1721087 RepID=A0A6N6N652_9BACT|nr:BPL-N domain-containing protein [Pseudodesulfovibrio senegalensis]KAB1442959.1 biotin--protein ligase [Pseudodesulfovibrio senegalensis]
MSSIHIYWDESHFWGLMAQRALKHWGIPHRLVRAEEIAQGALAGKLDGEIPRVLLVPGGRARGKRDRLGPAGEQALWHYVESGGTYIGFCGGAGLALRDNLGLCPWRRRPFSDRLQHFLSGHMHVDLNADDPRVPSELGSEALIPVWWPGQFYEQDNGVKVLASYRTPGPDFWVADICLKTLPKGTLTDWENLYGIRLKPDFLNDTPSLIRGNCGKGEYILSYAHLETPASPQANLWLASLLGELLEITPNTTTLPAWDVAGRPVVWDNSVLSQARSSLESIIETGLQHFLLFWRTPWLLGWRRGIPGAGINSLYSMICEAQAAPPTPQAEQFWQQESAKFEKAVKLLHEGLTGYLLAERLAMTVYHSGPSSLDPDVLANQRAALFGKPAHPGGIYAAIANTLETLHWHLQGLP